ncbi:retropepsin-like aspartic protease [Tsuneonella amylolytica]|uniref:retropepsin-like aspartic protease n=1 Tax=Tsuneonella amylolytica TaxID=2338327 RepID=UPI0013C457AF|nr:retropepsin-like aspartic protease [Tsuneonella amylolytica]
MAPSPVIAGLLSFLLLAAPPAAASEPGPAPAPVLAASLEAVPDFADIPPEDLIDGTRDRYSRMTVPVTIGGKGPFRFMIDTGSQATVVTPRLREQLQMPSLGRATLVSIAARTEIDLVRVDGLAFGSRVFDGIHAPLLEAHHIGADGILGLDSLQDLRVLIDFRGETIAVGDGKELGGNKGYEIVVRARRKLGRLIITDADIDGVRTAVVVDTGAQGSMGNRALQRRLRVKDGIPLTSTDVTGTPITGNLGVARQVVIGRGGVKRMELNAIRINYADAPAFAALGLANKPALILGIEDLRLFDRVAIDFSDRTLLFDLPDGTERPASRIDLTGRGSRL